MTPEKKRDVKWNRTLSAEQVTANSIVAMVTNEAQALEHELQICQLIADAKLSQVWKTREQVFLVRQYARELGESSGSRIGLLQVMNSSYPVNGRVAIMGDLAMALIQGSGKLARMEVEDWEGDDDEDGSDKGVIVHLWRVGQDEPWEGRFTWRMAQRAGLTGKATYKAYARDMMFWRAFARAARGFADVLKGCSIYEDVQDVPSFSRNHTEAGDDPMLNGGSDE